MQDLPKLHRNYSSGAIIWGSLHPTEENILLLRNIDIYNHTPVVSLLSIWHKKLDWFASIMQQTGRVLGIWISLHEQTLNFQCIGQATDKIEKNIWIY